jgi:hypothetical protein
MSASEANISERPAASVRSLHEHHMATSCPQNFYHFCARAQEFSSRHPLPSTQLRHGNRRLRSPCLGSVLAAMLMHIPEHWSLAGRAANTWCAAAGDMPPCARGSRQAETIALGSGVCTLQSSPCGRAAAMEARAWRRRRRTWSQRMQCSSSKLNGDDASVSRGWTRALHGCRARTNPPCRGRQSGDPPEEPGQPSAASTMS